MHLPRKGRGYALRAAWSTSDAPVVAYMDVDLSTSLPALLPLVAPLLSGHRDVAIGSRLAPGAHVVRGPKRELISRAYNLLLKLTLRGRFSDAQCGFKALRRDAAEKLLPLVEDNEWFFDTELLVTAERLGLRIGEVPVDWVDDPDSRVHIVSTATDDLRGVWRMLVRRPKGLRRVRSNEVAADQLLRFAGVGVVSTLGYLFLFVAWRPLLGAFGANAVAMAIATLFNTAVHRELSRTADGQARRGRLFAVAGGLYLVSLGLTTLGLVVAQWIAPSALFAELVALTVANVLAAVSASPCCGPGSSARAPAPSAGADGGVPMTDLTPDPRRPGRGARPADARSHAADRRAGRRHPPHRPGRPAPPRAGWPASSGARRATRPGSAPPCSRCSPPPPSSTCGTSAPAAGPTPSTRPPSRRARRAGRRSSSGPRTRPTSSPSTSRRRSCGRWRSRPGSSASTRGACWCPRPSRAWPPSAWSTCPSGAGSARRPRSSAAPWWR